MSNAVVIGRLRGVEAGAIVLDGELRIIVPPSLSVADFPIWLQTHRSRTSAI